MHVDTGTERTLRRPFSIAGVGPEGEVELLIELRGGGTHALADLQLGASVTMMGPLGHGFTLPDAEGAAAAASRTTEAAPRAVVVAGGIGVAGIRYLLQRLVGRGTDTMVFVGARTADGLLHETLTTSGQRRIEIATDDGSAGERGTVCDIFKDRAAELPPGTFVYGCGPRGMLDSLVVIASEHGLRCQLSLEEMMACGVGACRGCVVATVDGYRTVCQDGPVFDGSVLLPEGRVMEVSSG